MHRTKTARPAQPRASRRFSSRATTRSRPTRARVVTPVTTQKRRKFDTTKAVNEQQTTIFGAPGQVGRYTSQYLGPTGMRLIVPYRDVGMNVRDLKLTGDLGQVVPLHFDWKTPGSIEKTVQGSDLVINLIGSSRPTVHYNEHDANVKTALRIAQKAKDAGVTRFIHVSAAGASPSSGSAFLRAKYESEEAVKAYFPDATIVRPCFIYDTNNEYLQTLISQIVSARTPKIAFPNTKIQPTYARDVGAAIAQIALNPHIDGQTWTLAGREALTRGELFDKFSLMLGRPHDQDTPIQQEAPRYLTNMQAWLVHQLEQISPARELNRLTPRGSLDYFSTDVHLGNVPKTKGFVDLGIEPCDPNLSYIRLLKPFFKEYSPANSLKLFSYTTGTPNIPTSGNPEAHLL